jgi:hypothetical protein
MSDPDADLIMAGEVLLELESEQRPDIVHLNGFYHATLPFRAPVLVVAHSCVSSWWQACRKTPLSLEWSAYGERVAAGIAAADLVVAPTAAYLDEFLALHGNPRAAITVPQWPRSGTLAAGPKRQVALAAGRLWDEAKNISTLCRAAEGLSRPVMIAGDATSAERERAGKLRQCAWFGRLGSEEIASPDGGSRRFRFPGALEPLDWRSWKRAVELRLILGDIPTMRECGDAARSMWTPDDERRSGCPGPAVGDSNSPQPSASGRAIGAAPIHVGGGWPTLPASLRETGGGQRSTERAACACLQKDCVLCPRAGLVLEQRQCAFSARRGHGAAAQGARGRRVRAALGLEPRQPPCRPRAGGAGAASPSAFRRCGPTLLRSAVTIPRADRRRRPGDRA